MHAHVFLRAGSHYTDINGVKKIMASTQFEPLDARRALPCIDEPAIKAVFAVTIVVPAQLTAFSNMPESETVITTPLFPGATVSER